MKYIPSAGVTSSVKNNCWWKFTVNIFQLLPVNNGLKNYRQSWSKFTYKTQWWSNVVYEILHYYVRWCVQFIISFKRYPVNMATSSTTKVWMSRLLVRVDEPVILRKFQTGSQLLCASKNYWSGIPKFPRIATTAILTINETTTSGPFLPTAMTSVLLLAKQTMSLSFRPRKGFKQWQQYRKNKSASGYNNKGYYNHEQ